MLCTGLQLLDGEFRQQMQDVQKPVFTHCLLGRLFGNAFVRLCMGAHPRVRHLPTYRALEGDSADMFRVLWLWLELVLLNHLCPFAFFQPS